MLDDNLLSKRWRPSPFTTSYLAYRVNKEPRDGSPALLCIREVAERLTSDIKTRADYVAELCTLVADACSSILPEHRFVHRHRLEKFERPEYPSEEFFRQNVQAAAVFLNLLTEVDKGGFKNSRMFGPVLQLCVKSGSMEMVERYLRDANQSIWRNRCQLLPEAAKLGRLDMVQFIFNYDIENTPWRFEGGHLHNMEGRGFYRALYTPNPAVWDYVIELHRRFNYKINHGYLTRLLETCSWNGWTGTARRLLEQYSRGEIPLHDEKTFKERCVRNSQRNLVYVGRQWGPEYHHRMMTYGLPVFHLEFAQLLLEHGWNTKGAVVAAARRGHIEIVKALLEAGADANEEEEHAPRLSPICYAVLREHIPLFHCLIENGAKAPSLAMREEVAKLARKSGIESMLELLESWSIAQTSGNV
jgi:hypothetical protein